MNFEEWYEANAKYINPNDLYQWLSEAFEAGEHSRDKQYLQLKYDFAGKFDATKENVFVAIEAIANGSYEE